MHSWTVSHAWILQLTFRPPSVMVCLLFILYINFFTATSDGENSGV